MTHLNTKDKHKYKHPTVKPVSIINNFIINSSQEGDVVLDPFMGSGSTGEAALRLDRDFIGIELNEEYFSIAHERLNNFIY
ncbi:site-specific DNA-methyltransferase [Lactobacillus hominis]|uniref:site-specific DNA-methyltransferase n=1 Tax=Lactobacillus hominis TaxID=1203033 RepID=UPI0033BB344F